MQKRKKLDKCDKEKQSKGWKITYPLDEDDPFHQYKEEMDPCLFQQDFLPRTQR